MVIKKVINSLPWNKKIEILRVANSWTQGEAAERCNTNQKMYWNWEKGKNYPRKKSQRLIAQAYNVNVEDIFPV